MYFGIPAPGIPGSPQFDPERFDQLAVFQNMMRRAEFRCQDMAGNEKLFGYEDGYRDYCALVDDMKVNYLWMQEVLP